MKWVCTLLSEVFFWQLWNQQNPRCLKLIKAFSLSGTTWNFWRQKSSFELPVWFSGELSRSGSTVVCFFFSLGRSLTTIAHFKLKSSTSSCCNWGYCLFEKLIPFTSLFKWMALFQKMSVVHAYFLFWILGLVDLHLPFTLSIRFARGLCILLIL